MAYKRLHRSHATPLDGSKLNVPTSEELALRTAIDNVTGVEYGTRKAHRHIKHLRRQFPGHVWRLRRLPHKPHSRVITYAGSKARPW